MIFFSLAGVGLALSLVGCCMSKKFDICNEEVINMTLCRRIKYNFVEIKNGFKIKEFHRAVIYFVLLGALVPTFIDYFYYYLTDVAGISNFKYAMI